MERKLIIFVIVCLVLVILAIALSWWYELLVGSVFAALVLIRYVRGGRRSERTSLFLALVGVLLVSTVNPFVTYAIELKNETDQIVPIVTLELEGQYSPAGVGKQNIRPGELYKLCRGRLLWCDYVQAKAQLQDGKRLDSERYHFGWFWNRRARVVVERDRRLSIIPAD